MSGPLTHLDVVALAALAAALLLLALGRRITRSDNACVCDLWFGHCICHKLRGART